VKIYIAGASAEIERAERAIELARLAGFEVAYDWPANVREVGESNPPDATDEQRREWAGTALWAVAQVDAFWLLLPREPTVGAWFEFGAALARTGARSSPYIIASGDDVTHSPFVARAHVHAADDNEALAMLCAYRERGGRPRAA
jgi:hypothetical protein